jgi:4-aminobutyrate aminotransferase/(S)-3-amino-2-methylpropionate transaminase
MEHHGTAAAMMETISSQTYHEEEKYMSPGLQEVAQLSQLVIREGQGCWLTDMEGRRYLDLMAGVAVCSLGHSHPRYIEAIKQQLDKVTVGSFTTENRVSLLRLIASLTPAGLNKTQLFSGGAEAVEAAIRLAKSTTRKFEVLGFWGGFHGKTGGVLGLLGDPFKKHWGVLHPGLHLAPYADCYRCPFKMEHPSCGLFCLEFVRKVIENNTAGSLAAIIVEPIQGTAGNVIPPPEFLLGLLEIAHENGALLIADEMITGFGRTGRMFGSNHSGLSPDIMTIGKGLGNGFPISGLVSNEVITRMRWRRCERSWTNRSSRIHAGWETSFWKGSGGFETSMSSSATFGAGGSSSGWNWSRIGRQRNLWTNPLRSASFSRPSNGG